MSGEVRTLSITFHTGSPRPTERSCRGCNRAMRLVPNLTPKQLEERDKVMGELLAMVGMR